jgi:hypothetical protein
MRDVEFIRQVATSVLWQIEDQMDSGLTFDEAKRRAIARAEPAWKHLTTAADIRTVCWSIAPTDLSKAARQRSFERCLADIERNRDRKAGRIEKLLYRITGLVW